MDSNLKYIQIINEMCGEQILQQQNLNEQMQQYEIMYQIMQSLYKDHQLINVNQSDDEDKNKIQQLFLQIQDEQQQNFAFQQIDELFSDNNCEAVLNLLDMFCNIHIENKQSISSNQQKIDTGKDLNQQNMDQLIQQLNNLNIVINQLQNENTALEKQCNAKKITLGEQLTKNNQLQQQNKQYKNSNNDYIEQIELLQKELAYKDQQLNEKANCVNSNSDEENKFKQLQLELNQIFRTSDIKQLQQIGLQCNNQQNLQDQYSKLQKELQKTKNKQTDQSNIIQQLQELLEIEDDNLIYETIENQLKTLKDSLISAGNEKEQLQISNKQMLHQIVNQNNYITFLLSQFDFKQFAHLWQEKKEKEMINKMGFMQKIKYKLGFSQTEQQVVQQNNVELQKNKCNNINKDGVGGANELEKV